MGLIPKWVRPSGPLNVWKVIDGYEILEDGTGKPVKFSIQDVPNDERRRQEAFDHMHTHFLAEEPCAKSLRLRDSDPIALKDIENEWNYSLDQGASIACYKLDPNGEIKELVGINLIVIMTPETLKDYEKLTKMAKSPNYMKMLGTFNYLLSKADICKSYNVDRYITSICLSVALAFRGQKLGFHILDARSLLAEKYGFSVTATFFSSNASQLQANRAGFQDCLSIEWKELVDDKGNPMFPNIESKYAKLMTRRLP